MLWLSNNYNLLGIEYFITIHIIFNKFWSNIKHKLYDINHVYIVSLVFLIYMLQYVLYE